MTPSIRTVNGPAVLLAGVDNLSLDTRRFDPCEDDIRRICRFFKLGELQYFKKEKGITVSHSNFFVFVRTVHGDFALKFYPHNAARDLIRENAVNGVLTAHGFATPVMHAGRGRRPFMVSLNRLAACYSYLDGWPVWQGIRQKKIISQINASLLSLKNILSHAGRRLPVPKPLNFTADARAIARQSGALGPYDQKETIESTLLEACRAFQSHKKLFICQWLHSNASLTNFLVQKEVVYTLDLAHVQEDYALSDLASLVISCIFFKISATTIKAIIKDYLLQHKLEQDRLALLKTLVETRLIKEYLKNVQREKSVVPGKYPPRLMRAYRIQLSERKKSIINALKTGIPG